MKSLITNNFRFSEFELDPAKRLLFKAGEPVPLHPKTFDLLELLIAGRGQVLSKTELLDKLWENQFVEESNLTVHISTLRKTLGEVRGENRFILTVPGKGYKFVGVAGEIENERTESEISAASDETARETGDAELPAVDGEKTGLAGGDRRARKIPAFVFYLLPLVFLFCIGGYFWWRSENRTSVAPLPQMQIRQLTNNGKVEIAALSPDGKLFAYVTGEFGKKTLWLGQIDGGNNIELRPAAEINYSALVFAPENDKLYFSVREPSGESSTLFRMPVFGGAQEKIRDNIDTFALSPDGRRIAVVKHKAEENKDFFVVSDLNGGAEREIVSPFPAGAGSISFSPNGQTLAFAVWRDETNQDVYTAQIETGELRQITEQSFDEINRTVWTADGGGLILTARGTHVRSGVPQFRVWSIALTSGETRQITSDLSSYRNALGLSKDALLTIEHRQMNNIWVAPAENPGQAKQITSGSFGRYDGLWGLDWTPDGRIIYDSSNTQSQIISEMNADGSKQRELTSPGYVDSALAVSKDGRYIVFHSSRSEGFDIWRMDANGDHPTQLTFGGKNYQPTISPDSRSVYYKSWENNIGELRRISIDGGESAALTDKETSWSSVSPDGKFIGALYRTDKKRFAILPISGGQPLKQFDLPKSATFYGGGRWTPDGKAFVYYDVNYGYWQQSIEGGEPQRIAGLPKERLYNFAWSPDGKQFAFVRGTEIRDVVLISNAR
jgi:Tol biopolymer transport system component/DNA-binding winged helix-turn-helix (wHTH) protein